MRSLIRPIFCWLLLMGYGYYCYSYYGDLTSLSSNQNNYEWVKTVFWESWWLHTIPICLFGLYLFYGNHPRFLVVLPFSSSSSSSFFSPPHLARSSNEENKSQKPNTHIYPCQPTEVGAYSYFISSLHSPILFSHNVYPSPSILLQQEQKHSESSYTIHRFIIQPQQIRSHYCSYFEWLHHVHHTSEDRSAQFCLDFADELQNHQVIFEMIFQFLHTSLVPSFQDANNNQSATALSIARKLGCPELIRLWSHEELDIYMLNWEDWFVQEQEKIQQNGKCQHSIFKTPIDPAFLYYQQEWQRVDKSKFANVVSQNRLFYTCTLQTGLSIKWSKTQAVDWKLIKAQNRARYGWMYPCETFEEKVSKNEEEKKTNGALIKNSYTLADWLLQHKNKNEWRHIYAFGGTEHPQQATRDNVVLWSTVITDLQILINLVKTSLNDHNIYFVEYIDSVTHAHILLCENAFARIELRCMDETNNTHTPNQNLLHHFARQTIDMDAIIYDIYHGLWVASARGMIAWKYNCNRVHRDLSSLQLQNEHRIGLYQAQQERNMFVCMPGFLHERCRPVFSLVDEKFDFTIAYSNLNRLQNQPFQLMDILVPKLKIVDPSVSTQIISHQQLRYWQLQQVYYCQHKTKEKEEEEESEKEGKALKKNNMYTLLYCISLK